MPTSVILVRLFTPLLVLGVYWWLRIPRLTSPTADANVGIEWAVALALTLVGLGIAADGTVRLYRRIVHG
jgi:hypothetical protein